MAKNELFFYFRENSLTISSISLKNSKVVAEVDK